MKIEELIQGINLENREIEFKRFLNEGMDKTTGFLLQIRWLKTLAAFANCSGGKMYIGVDDETHDLMPLDAEKANEQILLIRRELQDRLTPSLSPEIKTLSIPGSKGTTYVIEVAITPSSEAPVMLKDRGAYTIYVRKYGYTEIAKPEEIRSLVLRNEQTSFDTLPTKEQYNGDDFKLLKEEYSKNHNGEELQDKTLQLKGLYDEDGFLKQGSLLFRDDCNDQKTKVSIVKWPGLDRSSSSLLSLIQLSGPITKVINEAAKNASLITTNGIKKTDTGETPLVAYPQRSVLEGIANAFAHRNYWMVGTQIQIDIFLDRMEITSPGSLLSGRELSKEKNISSIIPQHRNSLLSNILSLVGVIQGLGTGFDKIEQDYLAADNEHKPFVSSTSESFTLVLPDLTYRNGVIDPLNEKLPDVYVDAFDISEKERMILSYCYPTSRTVSEIAKHLGVSVSTYLKDEVIKKLVRKKYLIEYFGRPAKYITSRENVKISK